MFPKNPSEIVKIVESTDLQRILEDEREIIQKAVTIRVQQFREKMKIKDGKSEVSEASKEVQRFEFDEEFAKYDDIDAISDIERDVITSWIILCFR
jgi:hypothetical protein